MRAYSAKVASLSELLKEVRTHTHLLAPHLPQHPQVDFEKVGEARYRVIERPGGPCSFVHVCLGQTAVELYEMLEG